MQISVFNDDMTLREEHDLVKALLECVKRRVFHSPERISDEQAMGMLMSHYFAAVPRLCARAAAYALEDGNAHTLSAQLMRWAEGRPDWQDL